MANLIYIKGLKFQKKCASCGENIPKDAPCWWDKENKKNYHENHKPVQADPSAGKQTGRKEEGGNPDRVSPNSQTGSTQASLPEFDVIDNLKQGLLIANGAGFALGIPGVSAIVQEIMRERFELYLEQRKEKFWGKRID